MGQGKDEPSFEGTHQIKLIENLLQRRQRREFRKEKAFQAELLGQLKEAEKFSAEEYVETKIKQATDVPLPRYWKGKRLPAFIIKELIEKDQLKKQRIQEKKERFEKYRHVKL